MLLKTVQLIFLLQISYAYKVLLVFPVPYRSHAILGEGFVRHLTRAGHEVTYVTPYLIGEAHENLQQIEIGTRGLLDNVVNLKNILNKEMNSAELFNVMMKIVNLTLTDANVTEFLYNKNNIYDVAIIERMFIDVFSGFAAVFNCPYISFFSYHDDMDILELIHEVPNPAYTASVGTTYIPPLSFFERLEQLYLHGFMLIMNQYYIKPKEQAIYRRMFEPIVNSRGGNLPDYDDIRYNASLAFTTSHISYGNSYVHPLALKLIGGFHIDDALKPLPKKLREIMDKSENGVILFSMGSQVTSEGMPEQLKTDLIRIFSQLNYTVLWKLNKLESKFIPGNVKVVPWLPQQSILAHPRCVLFITHGGILSITESVHFGVPIVGIPGFGDQFVNVKTAVKNGYGLEVALSADMGDKLEEALHEVLGNPRFQQRAKAMSLIYHSRVMPPGDEMVFWTEYVVKTRGALHLRSPALSMPLYQKYFLDILATLCILLTIMLFIAKKMFIYLIKEAVENKKNN
ncbi:unnamed protein product [Leptosia nina]|uniref:UDP-glucuronosyltransferase n=1 Tax=Leptosia nina TaxID=320188 RepID=A0AAV1J7S4_9NEOP